MDKQSRLETLRQTLESAFAPDELVIHDETHLHEGHPGAREGAGHFRVLIVSEAFAGIRPVARHRLIYQALGDQMGDEIHALALSAMDPVEYRRKNKGAP